MSLATMRNIGGGLRGAMGGMSPGLPGAVGGRGGFGGGGPMPMPPIGGGGFGGRGPMPMPPIGGGGFPGGMGGMHFPPPGGMGFQPPTGFNPRPMGPSGGMPGMSLAGMRAPASNLMTSMAGVPGGMRPPNQGPPMMQPGGAPAGPPMRPMY